MSCRREREKEMDGWMVLPSCPYSYLLRHSASVSSSLPLSIFLCLCESLFLAGATTQKERLKGTWPKKYALVCHARRAVTKLAHKFRIQPIERPRLIFFSFFVSLPPRTTHTPLSSHTHEPTCRAPLTQLTLILTVTRSVTNLAAFFFPCFPLTPHTLPTLNTRVSLKKKQRNKEKEKKRNSAGKSEITFLLQFILSAKHASTHRNTIKTTRTITLQDTLTAHINQQKTSLHGGNLNRKGSRLGHVLPTHRSP